MPAFRESIQLHLAEDSGESRTDVDLNSSAYAVHLSGFTALKSGIHFSDFSENAPEVELTEASHAGGEWAGIFKLRSDPDTHVVLADPLGYFTLFYQLQSSSAGQTLTLGTSFQSVVDRLQGDRRSSSINWPVLTTHLAAKHTLFQTAYTNETMDSEIRTLGADEYLVVGPREVQIRPRSLFSDPERRSYDELLQLGIERSIHTITSAADSDVASKRINLSGGKDSRMVLALLIASGRQAEFTVTTVNPDSWGNVKARPGLARDLQVADFLRTRFGMKWSEPVTYCSKPHSFNETVQRYQSQWSNRKFKMPIGSNLVWPETPAIALRGGGGRAYESHRSLRCRPC